MVNGTVWFHLSPNLFEKSVLLKHRPTVSPSAPRETSRGPALWRLLSPLLVFCQHTRHFTHNIHATGDLINTSLITNLERIAQQRAQQALGNRVWRAPPPASAKNRRLSLAARQQHSDLRNSLPHPRPQDSTLHQAKHPPLLPLSPAVAGPSHRVCPYRAEPGHFFAAVYFNNPTSRNRLCAQLSFGGGVLF